MITVVNRKTHKSTENDIYVGRGSVLGNPYTSNSFQETKAEFICKTREESLQNFFKHINEKITQKDEGICSELNRIWKLAKNGHDINLVCYCAPQACHATIIKNIIEDKLPKHKTYVGNITSLKKNQVTLVGTNPEGRHGKGFAKICNENFGLRYGVSRGFIGQCYAIVTKDLRIERHPSVPSEEIKRQIGEFYDFAKLNPHLEFLVPYNCHDKNLNFYSAQDMASFFSAFEIPRNIVFEEKFYRLIKQ